MQNNSIFATRFETNTSQMREEKKRKVKQGMGFKAD